MCVLSDINSRRCPVCRRPVPAGEGERFKFFHVHRGECAERLKRIRELKR